MRTAAFAAADLDIGAGAPIYAGDKLVGLLSLGVSREAQRPSPARKAGAACRRHRLREHPERRRGTGPRRSARHRGTADHGSSAPSTAQEFHPVFQPIVDLESLAIVGYEALTRFTDGTRPDLRFTEAASVGLGHDYELAAIEAALAAASHLPEGAFLTLNMSPGLVLESGRRLRKMIRATSRRLILELTEHVPIDDYAALRKAIGTLGDVELAVDDAGAGYASLRHILELRPTFAKLDISLVRGIDADELRQALVAGLVVLRAQERLPSHRRGRGVGGRGERAAAARCRVRAGLPVRAPGTDRGLTVRTSRWPGHGGVGMPNLAAESRRW